MSNGAEMLLLYLVGGIFLVFVIVMGLGGHVMPTGAMVRSPTRRGDIVIAFFSVVLIIGLIWFSWGGWKDAVGIAKPEAPETVLFYPIAQQDGITHIGLLVPAAAQNPTDTKRQLRQYCQEFIAQYSSATHCVVMLWMDGRLVPRQFPIPANRLPSVVANYTYQSMGAADRFCWLRGGQVDETNCF